MHCAYRAFAKNATGPFVCMFQRFLIVPDITEKKQLLIQGSKLSNFVFESRHQSGSAEFCY
jgi:hypothetical protein